LERADILKRVIKGKYLFSFKEINDYELANFLLTPSYISLESALSFYGILAQFPYTITSVTTAKTRKIIYNEKEFEFAHLRRENFFGFVKKDNFLIAQPEKALLDELYFISKGLISISLNELNLSLINKNKLLKMMRTGTNIFQRIENRYIFCLSRILTTSIFKIFLRFKRKQSGLF